MPTWITHLMVADGLMKRFPYLNRRGFCAGNIAPDCNIENEDWSAYTPPRDVTHWMRDGKKTLSGCENFRREYISKRRETIKTAEQGSFLLGYYAHLLTDVVFLTFLLHDERVRAAWHRVQANDTLRQRSTGMEENWDSIQQLVTKQGILNEIYQLEAEYLRGYPRSGYLTEIIPLKEFPDYIDYLPAGCIVRKIAVMGYIPEIGDMDFIAISREEYLSFVSSTIAYIADQFRRPELWDLISNPPAPPCKSP